MFRVDHHHYGLGTGGWWLLMRQPCHATLDDRPQGFGFATVTVHTPTPFVLGIAYPGTASVPSKSSSCQSTGRRRNNIQCQSVTMDKKEDTKDGQKLSMARENVLEGKNDHVIA
jgi:hypothetical protein